ncbi:RNA pseudouridine synthase 1 [Linum perenne]
MGCRRFTFPNRLDRDTSGVMVITKSHKVAAKLVTRLERLTLPCALVQLQIGTGSP